jgi:hypothetical protein
MPRPIHETLCQRCRCITLDDLGAACHSHDDTSCSHMVRSRDELDDSCPLCQIFLNALPGSGPENVISVSIAAADLSAARPVRALHRPDSLDEYAGTKRKLLAGSRHTRYFPLSELSLTYSALGVSDKYNLSRLYVSVDDGEEMSSKRVRIWC